MMKLYGTLTSPYVRHCRIALAETGLDYELVDTDYEQSARLSPARRVPFLHDGERVLNDSLSILQHIRQTAGQPFLPNVADTDLFALTNTALDTAINVFLLEKDGITPEHGTYLARQTGRIGDILNALEARVSATPRRSSDGFTEGELRLGCFLAWALFRERLSLDAHSHLAAFLDRIGAYEPFAATPPRV